MDYQIISKGYYSYPQSNEQISCKQFMFALKDDKKCLLLRFTNNEESTLSGLEFMVQELDSRGNKVGEQLVKAQKAYCPSGDSFSVSEDIFVHDSCTDFKVSIVAADFGDYKYSYKKDNVSVSYAPNREVELNDDIKKQMGIQKKSITTKNFKLGGFLLIITVVVILAALGITWFQLDTFIDSTKVFTSANIEYSFVDGNIETGKVAITDYTGTSKNVIIPTEVEGLKVVSIENSAFNNKNIENLIIQGAVSIGDEAFSNCKELKTVDLGGATSIGSKAFYNCSSLTSISSSTVSFIGNRAFEDCTSIESITLKGTDSLTLGENVFQNCTSLKEITIDQNIINETGLTELFANDFNIERIALKSIGFSSDTDTLHKMYGKSYADSTDYALKEITLGYVSSINDYFFTKFKNLESITILQLENTKCGTSAFEDCFKLSTLNFSTLTNIGNSAFKNTSITSYDLSKIVNLGDNAFENCKSLDVNIKDLKLTAIPKYAFAGCSSIKSLEFNSVVTTINSNAFYYCSAIKNLTIPTNVTSIGLSAFEGCNSVESVSIPFIGSSQESEFKHFAYIFGNGNSNYSEAAVKVPESLTSITITTDITTVAERAFYNCLNVKNIQLPSSVTQIGAYAFTGCKALEGITIPTNISTIGNYAFSNCTKLTSITIPKTIQMIGSRIFASDTSLNLVSIPFIGATIEDNNKSFKYFFGDNESNVPASLKNVTIVSQENIPDGAFKNLSNISSIKFENAKSIGASAFEGCTSLTSVNIPSGVTEIKTKTFYNSGLQTISIPASITTVGESAFDGSKLTEITFNDKAHFTSVANNAFANTNISEIELPLIDTVGNYVFANNKSLKIITQVEGATTIGMGEFLGCTSLETVSLSNSLTAIGQDSFRDCKAIIEMNIPFVGLTNNNSTTNLAILFGATIATNGPTYVPSTLKTINVTNATLIPQKAFYGLYSIKSITLNEGISTIGISAFEGCTSLNIVNIPTSTTTIQSNAFSKCYKLMEVINSSSQSIEVPEPFNTYASKDEYNSNNKSFVTEDGYEFYQIRSGLYPEWYLVDYNHSLDVLSIPQITSWKFDNGTVTISSFKVINYFADGNKTITSLSIPKAVSTIGDYAFDNCINLTTLSFADGGCLETIGNNTFFNCQKLTTAEIPSGVTSIGINAFHSCVALSIVYLPETLSAFGNNAFNNCPVLFDVYDVNGSHSLTCGDTTYGYVAANALLIHTNLNEAPLHDSIYGGFTFKTNGSVWILYSVDGSMPSQLNFAKFKSTEEGTALFGQYFTYSIHKNIFKGNASIKSMIISDAVTSIPEESFYNCANLETVNMSNATELTAINNKLFINCTKLTTLTLPTESAISTVGDQAFMNCYSLLNANLPNSVSAIGESAFENCYRLESTIIPEGILTIEKNTFSNCYRLFNVSLPSSLTTIGDNAFIYCYGLSSITIPTGVSTIGSSAFQNCTHLYQIINQSTLLSIVKGSSDNGYIAINAIEVVSNVNASTFKAERTDDGYYFAYYSTTSAEKTWHLYSMPAAINGTLKLQSNYTTQQNSVINTYSIAPRSYVNPTAEITIVHVPGAVSSIASYWYYPAESHSKDNSVYYGIIGTLYYGDSSIAVGSTNKAIKEYVKNQYSLRTDNSLTTGVTSYFGNKCNISYYVNCVHYEGEWTYVNGDVSTEIHEFVKDRVKSSDCATSVTTYYVCPYCHDEETVSAAGEHDFDDNHQCKVCHWTSIDGTNITKHCTLTNSGKLAYKGTAITMNSSSSDVVIEYTATKETEIAFTYDADIAKSSGTIFSILYNNARIAYMEYKAEGNTPQSFYLKLAAGDTITIKLSTSLATAKDKAYINDLRIKETN